MLDDDARPELSVVVTLFEEQATLDELHARLTSALEAFGRAYEVLYVDDGSTDGTFATLQRLHEADPRVRAVRLKRNSGQHPAMHAGLTRIRGAIVVTMDGDLQNPPEDVPRLVEAVEAGYDVASGRRAARHDSWGRTLPSRLINGMLRRFTGVDITDFGCAFNAYRREAVEPMLGAIGRQKFTKALVLSGGASVVEVDVGHAPRDGASRYSPLRLTRLALHVLAGFWPQPIQTAGIVLGTRLLARLPRARRLRRSSTGSRTTTSRGRCSSARSSSPSSASRASSSPSSASISAESSAWSSTAPSTSSTGSFDVGEPMRAAREPPPSWRARAEGAGPPGRPSRPPAALAWRSDVCRGEPNR